MRQLLAGRTQLFARRITRPTLTVTCVALAAVVFPATPAFAAPVTCGSTVTTSTRLDADLVCGAGVALHLSGQNIVLNLGGHTISGSGVGIQSTFGQNSTIRNGTIRGFGVGAALDRTVGVRIQNINFISNGIGVDLSRVVGTVIVNNRVTGSESAGVNVNLSAQNRIARNTLRGNGVGITLAFASDNVVSQNLVIRSRGDGIALLGSTSDNVVTDNIVFRNGDDGIDVDSAATTVSRNIAIRNVDLGIEAVAGVVDGGGNIARRNGNPMQCTGVVCAGAPGRS
jgi:parallel beta-helix repeat protein